jgi:hypothetical protein
MKAILHLISCCFFLSFSFAQTVFESDNAMNDYAFSRSNLMNQTTGYLLDFESDYAFIDSCLLSYSTKKDYSTTDLLQQFSLLERTSVNHSFEKDEILFPVMDYYYSLSESNSVDFPLFMLSNDFSLLTKENQTQIRSWKSDSPFPTFNTKDFRKVDLFCAGFFSNKTVRKEKINIYWNDQTILSNQSKKITKVSILNGKHTFELVKNEPMNVFEILGKSELNNLNLEVQFDDNSFKKITILCDFRSYSESKSAAFSYDESGVIGENPTLEYRTIFGCGNEKKMDKPYFLVAGWGPFTDKPMINEDQSWPSSFEDLYAQFNMSGFIENLLNEGYDVVISKFSPPNADINLNADRLIRLITKVNQDKYANGSYQENIVQGFSAGALCAKLALQKMEKAHLEKGGAHPHTKLFVSFDGENAGANIPLGLQKAVEYLEEYEMNFFNFKIYALHYILNAPLSKQLLKYFHTELGPVNNPGQAHHPLRSFYLWEHGYANHAKNTHLPNYPSFTRNVSISNGSHKSSISNYYSDHFPYENYEDYILFEKNNTQRKWKVALAKSGGNQVFYFKKKSHGVWYTEMGGVTNNQCLVLDNAPGGIMFIKANPLPQVIDQMNSETIGSYNTYRPSTLFAFTPTLLTHDIRNFNPSLTNYRLDYDMKINGFMFQNESDIPSSTNDVSNYSNYFGYPHLSKPNSHYWELTPFDAVFSAGINTEHLLSNEAVYVPSNDELERWEPTASPIAGQIKNFILDESDYFNAFVQNKRYGWYARSNYKYKAEIIARNEVFAGNHITQKTDFKNVDVLSNAEITFQAGKSISLTSGFTVVAGGKFHAFIEDPTCSDKRNGIKAVVEDKTATQESQSQSQRNEKSSELLIIPNPNQGRFTVRLIDYNGDELKLDDEASYFLYNSLGVLIEEGVYHTKEEWTLKSGIYILKIKSNESIYTEKISIQ